MIYVAWEAAWGSYPPCPRLCPQEVRELVQARSRDEQAAESPLCIENQRGSNLSTRSSSAERNNEV